MGGWGGQINRYVSSFCSKSARAACVKRSDRIKRAIRHFSCQMCRILLPKRVHKRFISLYKKKTDRQHHYDFTTNPIVNDQ